MRRASAWPNAVPGALALGIVLATLPAAGQGASDTTATRKGRFHVGPFWLTPRIVLRNAGSDSNVFNDAEQPVSDSSVVLEPGLDALLPVGRRLRILGYGTIGFNYFQREHDERSTDISGHVRPELDIGPATLFGELGGGQHKQRFSLEVDQRLDRTDQSVSAGLNLRLGRKLVLGGVGTESSYRYQNGVVVGGNLVDRSLDRDTRTLNGNVNYSLTRHTTLAFAADVVEDTFVKDTLVAAPAGSDTARSYRYTGGFSFAAGGLFTGYARAGWRHYPSTDTQVVPPLDELALGIDLTTDVGRLGALTVFASRDVSYAVERVLTPTGQSRNSYVDERYGATLNTELPGSLVARGSITFNRAQYVLPYVENGQPLDRADRLRILGVGLFRAFGPTFRVGGTVEWSERDSNLGSFGYHRRVYGLSAEYTP